jgi:nitroreductase
MGIYQAMSTLRAVRRLKPDPIPDDVLHRVLEAATWAPTGGNVQPWRAVVVKDPQKRAALGKLYLERWKVYVEAHRRLIADALDDVKEKGERMLAAGDYLGDHFGEAPAIVVFCFNPKGMAITDAGLDRISVVGGASVYTAVENFLLACRAESLGCTLTTLLCEVEPEVCKLLAIPEGWGTACAVPIGWPKLRGHGPITRRPVERLTFVDEWKKPYA